jgi:hypothetical protein
MWLFKRDVLLNGHPILTGSLVGMGFLFGQFVAVVRSGY